MGLVGLELELHLGSIANSFEVSSHSFVHGGWSAPQYLSQNEQCLVLAQTFSYRERKTNEAKHAYPPEHLGMVQDSVVVSFPQSQSQRRHPILQEAVQSRERL